LEIFKNSFTVSYPGVFALRRGADTNIMNLLQGEHPEILAEIGEGYRKSGFRRTKAL